MMGGHNNAEAALFQLLVFDSLLLRMEALNQA